MQTGVTPKENAKDTVCVRIRFQPKINAHKKKQNET